MKKTIAIALLLTLCSTAAFSHSGRTDSKGGHNCSQKSKDKGLCTGYHYHNGKAVANNTVGHEDHHLNDHIHDHDGEKKTVAEESS